MHFKTVTQDTAATTGARRRRTPQHTAFRQLIEPYFAMMRVHAFETECRRIARQLLTGAAASDTVEIMDAFARHFATRVQCAFLGWSEEPAPALATWTLANQAAPLRQDREALSRLAAELARYPASGFSRLPVRLGLQ